MRNALAAFLLCLVCGTAAAQSQAYGITLGNLQAVRDSTANLSTITGSLANQSDRNVRNVMLTFVLFDEQNHEIGRVTDNAIGPIAPGQIKQIRAITPIVFVRFTPLEIQTD